jgi:hypothetical protein
MSAPTFVFSETNGSGATVTDNVPQIAFASVDSPSTTGLSAANPIQAGSSSYEKYERLKVTGVAPNSLSNFGVYFPGSAPTDSGGSSSTVADYFKANATYAQPVMTVSTVATTSVATDTVAPGTSITAPANTLNSYSGYVALQFQSTSSAAGGNAIFSANFFSIQYSWS